MHGEGLTLVGGFLDVPPIVSTFATPVFKIYGDNEERFFIQKVGGGGFIDGFVEVHVADRECLIAHKGEGLVYKIGDAAVYAYFDHTGEGLLFGNRFLMSDHLRGVLAKGISNEYTHYEVLEFLGRHTEASRIIIDLDSVLGGDVGQTAIRSQSVNIWDKLALIAGQFVGQVSGAKIIRASVVFDGVPASRSDSDISNCMDYLRFGVATTISSLSELYQSKRILDENGIEISFIKQGRNGAFDGYIKAMVETEERELTVALTAFSDELPRVVELDGVSLDARVTPHMLIMTYEDVPGMVGLIAMTFGKNGVHMRQLSFGQNYMGGSGFVLVSLDARCDPKIIETFQSMGMFEQVRAIEFEL